MCRNLRCPESQNLIINALLENCVASPSATTIFWKQKFVGAMTSFLGDDEDLDLNELTDEQHDKRLEASLARFWEQQNEEMAQLEVGTEQDFKNHNDLPLARIKRSIVGLSPLFVSFLYFNFFHR